MRSISFPGSTPVCGVFFPGRTCADYNPRSSWKQKTATQRGRPREAKWTHPIKIIIGCQNASLVYQTFPYLYTQMFHNIYFLYQGTQVSGNEHAKNLTRDLLSKYGSKDVIPVLNSSQPLNVTLRLLIKQIVEFVSHFWFLPILLFWGGRDGVVTIPTFFSSFV